MKSAERLKKEQEESILSQDPKQEPYSINIRLSIHIEDLIEEMGIDVNDYAIMEGGIRGKCMCHGGNNPTGWSFYRETGTWRCWTQHCEDQLGSNCIGLIRAVLKYDFFSAIKFAQEFLSSQTKLSDEEIEQIRAQQIEKKIKAKDNFWNEHKNPVKIFSNSILSVLSPADNFAISRKLDPKIFHVYGIGIAEKGVLANRVVIPIRNIDGHIIGFSGRRLSENAKVPKWYHWPTKSSNGQMKTSLQLFNINNAFAYNIQNRESTYIITEGPFDTIKMEMSGIKNSVCTFGAAISDGQIELLKNIGATRVYVAYDGDKAGKNGANKARKKLEKNLFCVSIIDLEAACPDWPEGNGSLDWASEFISPNYIQKIMENSK